MPANPTQASRGRVERFRFASARTTKKHAPWAERIVRVGGIFVAYERAEDANEEHAPVCVRETRKAIAPYAPTKIDNMMNIGKWVADARRRGENA